MPSIGLTASIADITTDLVTMILIFTNPNMDSSSSYSKYAELHHTVREENASRRLRYVRGGNLVDLPPVTKNDFEHLQGLEEGSDCFHLFLSRERGLTLTSLPAPP